jgi:TRAP-type C4-dicarboxylate transport system permease small subunit
MIAQVTQSSIGVTDGGDPRHLTGGTTVIDDAASEGRAGPVDQPPSNWRWWVLLGLAEVLVFLLAVAGAGLALETVAHRVPSAASKTAHGAGAVAVLAVMVACAHWAARIGDRVRRGRAIATGLTLGIFALFTVLCAITAVLDQSAATRSGYTQSHGVRATATVMVVGEQKKCGAGAEACEYTAEILARLSPPVNGTAGTFIHYPGYSKLDRGQNVTVLVDPKQPTYAEIPGARFATQSRWIVYAILAFVFAVLSVREVLALRRLRSARQGSQAISAPES